MRKSFSIISKSLLVPFLFLAMSCTKDGAEDIAPVTEAQYQIKIVNIKLTDSNDIGSGVDVFGEIRGRLTENGKWMEKQGQARWARFQNKNSVDFKGTYAVKDKSSTITTVIKDSDLSNYGVSIWGKLWDEDLLSNDFMGEKSGKIDLSGLKPNKTVSKSLKFNDQKSLTVEVKFEVKRLK